MNMTISKTTISPVDIRTLAAGRCGIRLEDRDMSNQIAGVLSVNTEIPHIALNKNLDERWKRVVIAAALDACLEEGGMLNVIVEGNAEDAPRTTEGARRLLMPEVAFLAAYRTLSGMGRLAYSMLAAGFQVPLGEVMKRLEDLNLLPED